MKITIHDDLMKFCCFGLTRIVKLKIVHEDYSVGNVYSRRPRISYHKPNHTERYDKYEVDDITVYVEKIIKTKNDHLEFVLEKLMGKHSCHVKGIELDAVPSEIE